VQLKNKQLYFIIQQPLAIALIFSTIKICHPNPQLIFYTFVISIHTKSTSPLLTPLHFLSNPC
jgi:hypothetical protein